MWNKVVQMRIRNIDKYRAGMNARIKKVKEASILTHREAASLMAVQAKKLAPRKGGALLAGIRVRHGKTKSTVSSTVDKNFPYHFWVNRTAPYITLTWPKGAFTKRGGKSLSIAPGTTARYGETPNWNWTGTKGYFDLARDHVVKKYNLIAKKHLNNVWRVRVS